MHHPSAPGDTIFRRSRWLSGFYLVAGIVFWCLAILFLLVALGEGVGEAPRSGKAWGVAGWVVGALSFALSGFHLFQFGRAVSRSWVMVCDEGVRMRMPASDGELVWAGPETLIGWDTIEGVTYKHTWRENTCTIYAGGELYRLDKRNCSEPHKLAELVAAKKGISLTAAS